MEKRKQVLIVGLQPELIDFSSPEYAAFPGLTAEKVMAGLNAGAASLQAQGYEAQLCLTDFGATAEEVLRSALIQKQYDCVLVGAGVRTVHTHFLLFEKIINTIHAHAPGAKICFNTNPGDTAEAVNRWIQFCFAALMILPDLLQANLNIVFCGTAPGTVSAQRGAYYANAGNAFWRTLFEVGLTPHQVSPKDFQSITKYRLGLTDLAKQVYGADSSLKKSDFGPGELREKILHHAPKILAFTSKRAGQEFLGGKVQYGLQTEKIGNTWLFVLPSPSGLARSHWSIMPWQDLAVLSR